MKTKRNFSHVASHFTLALPLIALTLGMPEIRGATTISDGTSNTILIGENTRFNNGSSGALGDVVIDVDQVIDLPPNGILHFRSLTVSFGSTLRFKRNALNTPVFILSQQDVVIEGTIDVSGNQSPNDTPTGGAGGPGGFDGGKPGFSEVPPGAGYGPGAGRGGNTDGNAPDAAGSGSYATVSASFQNQNKGSTYGSKLLIPLIGGSGGGGTIGAPGRGGGGGGGAILVSSNTRILISGHIFAIGGPSNGGPGNGGSGGAVRLLAPQVAGGGEINVLTPNDWGGRGRIRVDTLDRAQLRLNFQPVSALSVGANMFAFPPVVPKLDIIEVAGAAVPVGSGPVSFQLPFGSDPNRTIKVQASGWGRVVPIKIVLTPDSGTPTTFAARIDNSGTTLPPASTGQIPVGFGDGSVRTITPSVASVPVVFPINTLVTIQCWNTPAGEVLQIP
jgi:hypothetical protein